MPVSKSMLRIFAAAALLLSATALPVPALAKAPQLPAPYVSRGLDAVLIPIDQAVRKAFGLKKRDNGVLVLAVQPGGTADRQGLRPGDVLSAIKGYRIRAPADADAIVYYWISQNIFDFIFDYGRAGRYSTASWQITREEYYQTIEIASIATWSSWSSETSFSYSEYYSAYSSEMSESYETSETLVEEMAASDEFAQEATADAADNNNDGVPDGDTGGTSDDTATDDAAPADGNDGDTSADSADDQPSTEQPADDSATDSEAPTDDTQTDEAPADDAPADEAPADDGGSDDGGSDDGGDDVQE